MLTLALTACLLGEPDRCRTYQIQIAEEGMGLMACMMISQQVISKWATEKPGFVENFYVKKWSCSYETGKDI